MAGNTVFVRIQTNSDLAKVVGQARASLERLAASPSHRQIANGVRSISEQLDTMRNLYIGLVGVLPRVAAGAAGAVRLAEAYQQANARLKNAADGVADFAQSQAAVNRIAISARQPLESVAGLYSKLRTNAGLASNDAERLTETLAKAVQLDGGGASAEAALFQLQQGLASGILRGEELNSVLEQAPSLAKAIADGLGVPVGALRQLAEQGRLTTAEIKRALNDQADEIEARFANLPVTVGQALQNLRTQAVGEFGRINESLGLTQSISGLAKTLAENIQATVAVATAAAFAIAGAFLQSIATRRAAEKAAHIARLREIVTETTAALSAAKAQTGAGRGAAVASAAASLVAARGALADAAKSTSLLRGAFSSLIGVLRLFLGPVGLVLTAVGTLTGLFVANRNALVDLGNGQATLAETVRAAWQLIVGMVGGAVARIGERFSGILRAGSGTFGALVDLAKGTANALIGLFVAAAKAIGTTFGAIARQVAVNFTGLKDLFAGLFKDIQAALSGDFSFRNFRGAVAKALAGTRDNLGQFTRSIRDDTAKAFGTDYVGAIGKGIARGVKEIRNTVGGALLEQVRKNRDAAADAQAEAFFNQQVSPAGGVTAATDSPGRSSKARDDGDKARREAERLAAARLELEETLAAQAGRLAEDGIRRDIELNKEAFDAKRIDAEAYYARLVALQETLAAAEIAALTRQRDAAAEAVAAATRKDDAPAALKATGEVAKLNTDIELARRKLEDFRREAATGLADAQAARTRGGFDTLAKQIDAQLAALREKEQALKNQIDLGLPQAAAEAQINAARRETLATTSALVAKLEELATLNPALFGDEALAQIARYKSGLADLDVVVDSVATRINSAVSTAFEKLFADIGSGAATAKDALLGFLRAVVGEINAVVGKNLAQSILGSILPTGQAGATGGLGGFISGILGGGAGGRPDGTPGNPVYVSQRDPLKLDGAALNAEGGLFGGLREKLTGLFDGLKSGFAGLFSGLGNALSGLFGGSGGGGLGSLFSGVLKLFGFASGGYTGDGGKYQPAGIVHAGEYVFPQEAVRRLGVATLANLQRFATGGFAPVFPRLGYADGGLVNLPAPAAQAAPARPVALNIVNAIDPGVTHDHLNTPAGERTITNIIARNSGVIRQSLGI